MSDGHPLLVLDRIDKSFFGVRVLEQVSFSLGEGRVLGLVGENGAGKSTLMNILGGVVQKDAGTIEIRGEEYAPRGPRDAQERGIAFIHQELNLFSNLSVEENLFLSRLPCRRRAGVPVIHRADLRAMAREHLESVDLHVPPGALVESLSQGERQLAEIAKALSSEASIIIFDEPTTSLTARETERLFGIIEKLKARNISVIYISHILGDVLRVSDQVVVLRDGSVVGAGPRDEFSMERMISLMVGRRMDQLYPPRSAPPSDEVALRAESLSQPGIVQDVRLEIRRGEILGLFGLMGSGRTELARILFGLDSCAKGEIFLGGASVLGLSPRERMDRGMAFLTENRRDEGLLMDASIADNMGLVGLRGFARRFLKLIDRERLMRRLAEVGAAVRLNRPASDRGLVKSLSGGNQQKVVLGKWLVEAPSVLILDEPTRGVDVGAKYEVYGIMDDLAARGTAIFFISSELEELLGMCDRILVMRGGEVKDRFDRSGFEKEKILRAAFLA